MNLLPEVEVVVMTPHHYPLGKGRGSGTMGSNPLKKGEKISSNKRRRPKRNTHFGHTHPSFKRILIHTFIPVIGIHDSHIVVLKVWGESFVPIQRLGPPIVHNDGGRGHFGSGITTGGWRRDEGVGGSRGRHGRDGRNEMMGEGQRKNPPYICFNNPRP